MNRNLRISRRSGFTLVELLVVIAIIGLLMGIAVMGLQSIEARRVDTALRDVQSKLSQARQWAITTRQDTCLIIPVGGPTDREDRRSYMLVSGKGNTMTNQLSDWNYLPEGVFFDDSSGLEDSVFHAGMQPLTFNFEHASPIPPGAPVRYFRFNSRGAMTTSDSDLRLYVAEGFREEGGSVTPRDPDERNVIRVRRLTGLAEIHQYHQN